MQFFGEKMGSTIGGNSKNMPIVVGKDVNEKGGAKPNQPSGIGDHINIIAEGVDDLVKGLTSISTDINPFPSDAVDEGPIVKPIPCFYFAEYVLHENIKLKFQIDQADEWKILKINQARFHISEKLQIKEAERTLVLYQLKPLILKDKTLGQMLKWKKNNLIYRQHSQGKIIRARTVSRERVVDLCSSAQEQIQARPYRPGTIYQGHGKVHSDMAKLTEINSQLKLVSVKDKRLRKILKLKMKDVNGEHQAQGRLSRERTITNVRSVATASEGEQNDLIGSKLHQMQHGSRTLSEEKKTLRDINMFVSTKEKSTANETTKAETQYTRPLCDELLAHKKAIEDGIKDVNLDEVRKEKQAVSMKIKFLEKK